MATLLIKTAFCENDMNSFPIRRPICLDEVTIVDTYLDMVDAVAEYVIFQDKVCETAARGTDTHD